MPILRHSDFWLTRWAHPLCFDDSPSSIWDYLISLCSLWSSRCMSLFFQVLVAQLEKKMSQQGLPSYLWWMITTGQKKKLGLKKIITPFIFYQCPYSCWRVIYFDQKRHSKVLWCLLIQLFGSGSCQLPHKSSSSNSFLQLLWVGILDFNLVDFLLL